MSLINRSQPLPLAPLDPVPAVHEADRATRGIVVAGEEAQKAFARPVPSLHVREVRHRNLLATLDARRGYELKLINVVRTCAAVNVRWSGGAMGRREDPEIALIVDRENWIVVRVICLFI